MRQAAGPTPPRRSLANRLHGWLDERVQSDSIWHALFLRKVPIGVNWLYTLGFASMAVFIVQAVTGGVLALYYSPSPDHAYDSVQYVMTEVPFGEVIRGIHHWGASAMVALVAMHMLVVFMMGAYKYPRETTWVVGVLLFLLTVGFGFTGYLLPWDEKAYWATTVGTNIAGTVPEMGGVLARVLRGGAELGALTLTRFYASHVLLLPMALATLVAVHLFLVIRQGVSVPPRIWDRGMGAEPSLNDHLIRSRETRITGEAYKRRYDYFKRLGRPFFPDVIFEDTVAAVLVVLMVLAMAVYAGAGLESPADPANTAYVPRPEWYFMFLFELLKYFPGALEWVGAVLIPSLFLLGLFALPFLSRRPHRSPGARPLSVVLAGLAVAGVVALTVMAFQSTPPSGNVVEERAARLTAVELAGKQVAQAQNCAACHVINGQGAQAGPPLDGIAARRDPAYIHTYIENPKSLNPQATMPGFIPPLSHEQVEEITRYLLTLK